LLTSNITETQRPILSTITGGLSGPAIKPIALRMVWQVHKAVKVPVIGIGGIMNATDAIEFLLAGASAIQVGTANLLIHQHVKYHNSQHIASMMKNIMFQKNQH
jgi:dihydroorotate dehydrogenase